MKNNTKSSVTLPPSELELVKRLQKILKAKSKVEVIRQGLHLLQSSIDRKALREGYKQASQKLFNNTLEELNDLDHLSDEGI